jgi:acyl transferase domain-containing protein
MINMETPDYSQTVAIIGMAGRFPGADNIEKFWENLRKGVETIKFFSDRELLDAGIPQSTIDDPNYVKARGVVDHAEMFDSEFFGVPQHTAINMDPQQRVLLETVWHALENSGYCSEEKAGVVSVYTSAGQWDSYLWQVLNKNGKSKNPVENFQRFTENSQDFLATHISYIFNFTGPSYNVQSACSTGLLSVCLACESLLLEKCDMAISATVNLMQPRAGGYFYTEGMVFSQDGHCRPYDVKADGTVGSEGVGVVILKRTEDAIRDGDNILAVIKGFGVNNDGSDKVGYAAPSITGESNVIIEALTLADVDPETIRFVETHGTATKLGDPIEINALTKAYRTMGAKKNGYCAVGALKSNVGHMDVVAGTGGLIKAVLALKNLEIPPTLNYEKPNPEINFPNTPFYVCSKLTSWEKETFPRRAGVSSFGAGGTNTHLILEEAPQRIQKTSQIERKLYILPLSAKSDKALKALIESYIEFLGTTKESIVDICFSTSTGRMHYDNRAFVIGKDVQEVKSKLEKGEFAHMKVEKDKKIRGKFKIDVNSSTKWDVLLSKIGDAYIHGATIDWSIFEGNRVSVPLYPFQRQRFWPETISGKGVRTFDFVHPFLTKQDDTKNTEDIIYQTEVNTKWPESMPDHTVYGDEIIAGMTYVSSLLSASRELGETKYDVISNFEILRPVILSGDQRYLLQTKLKPQDNGYDFIISGHLVNDVSTTWIDHITGKLSHEQDYTFTKVIDIVTAMSQSSKVLDKEAFYQKVADKDVKVGKHFKWVENIHISPTQAIAKMRPPDEVESSAAYVLYPGFLDACYSVGRGIGLDEEVQNASTIYIPVWIDRFVYRRGSKFARWVYSKLNSGDTAGGMRHVDIVLLDEDYSTVAEIINLTSRIAPKESIQKMKTM